jgi:hypothetical protein
LIEVQVEVSMSAIIIAAQRNQFRFSLLLSFCTLVFLCQPLVTHAQRPNDTLRGHALLPTGARLDPAGRSFDVGNMPLSMVLSPEGDRIVVLLCGWHE